ncbi:uncharacterized protein LOC113295004 [Papaver somniferum]|uniref:uncharacterized protein LOC113295004 n=1 Tax=Papaver somniferum TaxID=3469 RepID=UPI000E6F64DE|nr:uncharacterized protein LOC113295004 [Papaver somniferum]
MGQNYTENLKLVNDGLTNMSKSIDTLVTALEKQHLEEEEKNKTKVVEKRQQREEERVAHQQEITVNNTTLTDAITTSMTTALTTALNPQLTRTTTSINTQLTASLHAVFAEYLPQVNTNNGNGNGPHPPPPPLPPTPPAARANAINLKFPTFDGEDHDGWIFNADQYFSVHQAEDALKITIAASSLKGDSNVWYRWKQTKRYQTKVTIVTWLEFCAHVRARFSPEKFVDARLAINTINQVSTVREHIPAFEKLLNFVDFPDDYLISCFVRSLKPHIGSVVKLLAPQTLNEAFTKAIHQEEAYATVHKLPARQPYRPHPLRGEASTSTTPIKKLTLPTGFLLLEMDPTSSEDITEIEHTTEDHQVSDDLVVVESTPTISLNSLLGSTFPNTMRITVYAKARPLTLLIDSESTHNFLHPSSQAMCGCDAVLGIQWMRTLGEIIWDFEKLTMQFSMNDTAVTLTGNQSSTVMIMNVSPMQRLLFAENYGILLELVALNTSAAKQSLSPGIQQLLSKFSDIFSTPTTLPPARLQDHKISLLPEAGPVNVCPYRYPHFQKDEIEKIVGELQQAGFIRPISSPFSSPILLVRKKDGSWCMCIDYRALKKITIKDRYPIPVVDEFLDELYGKKVFTKLDLRYGYHQIRVHEADIPKTAFRTHDGHYEFLLYSETLDDHLKHLELVFDLLRTHKLFVKESKCTFAQQSIGHLGHLISSDGVSVEPEKIQCILSWKIPSSVKELREEATVAFKSLQHALTTTPVLILPDFSKEFYLECDASGGGIGAVLMQSARPITFYSKPLSGKNLNLSVYDKEMLAIVSAVNKWRPYLLGRHFKIYTDHRSLKYFLEQRISSIEQHKWVSKLLGYDYEIIYRSGSSNKAADALSRLVNPQLLALSAPIFTGVHDIITECHNDPNLRALID